LDLAASGALVVTNAFLNKVDLTSYSKNIHCADLNVDALVEAIEKMTQIDNQIRDENYRSNGLLRNWEDAFDSVLNGLSTKSGALFL
jgi:hypothetical protein